VIQDWEKTFKDKEEEFKLEILSKEEDVKLHFNKAK
jgi:hypothetical protein